MYIRCLNGLRAFAILLVILGHSSRVPNLSTTFKEIVSYSGLGTIGVRLFFLMSGFLITLLLDQEYESKKIINIKNFFIRRFLRIFPCFYFYLFTLILLRTFKIIDIELNAIMLSFLYIQNLNVFQLKPLFTSSWLVIHSWSLSVEEQFYIVFPFAFTSLKNLFSRKLIYGALISLTIGTLFRGLNYSYPVLSRSIGGSFFMHSDYLFFGCCLTYLYKNKKSYLTNLISPFKNLGLIISIVLLIFASRFEYQNGIFIILSGNVILFANLYVLSYFLLFPDSKIGQFLENKVLVYVGKLSYSLYVWQQLFLSSTEFWLQYKSLTLFPLNYLLIICCALVSYHFIEMPFLKLKHKFSSNSYSNH